jgi:hypothetical protein
MIKEDIFEIFVFFIKKFSRENLNIGKNFSKGTIQTTKKKASFLSN